MQDGMDNDSGQVPTSCVQTEELYVEPSNDVDIIMAVWKLKNGKATGHDQFWLN